MKVAYLSCPRLPHRSAHTIHIMKMCQALSDIGHDVYLIGPTLVKNKNQSIHNFYNVNEMFEIIETTNLRVIGNLINKFLSVQKAVNIDPDLIYTRDLLPAYIASSKGLLTVYESHMPVPYTKMGQIRNIIFEKLIKKEKFLQLVVISESMENYYLDNYDIRLENITLARDGSDPVNFNISSVKYSNDKSLQVGYVGNLYKGRGKNIIKYLARECDFAHFHIIGGGEKDIKIWKKELDFDNITFHGFIPQSKLDRYRLGFDVFLAPYQRNLETATGENTVKWMSPLKIFEYMATGKPMIASDLPAIREVLTHKENALLCSPENLDEWVESLNKLRDPNLRKKLGKNALDEFIDNYTWKKRAEKVMGKVTEKTD